MSSDSSAASSLNGSPARARRTATDASPTVLTTIRRTRYSGPKRRPYARRSASSVSATSGGHQRAEHRVAPQQRREPRRPQPASRPAGAPAPARPPTGPPRSPRPASVSISSSRSRANRLAVHLDPRRRGTPAPAGAPSRSRAAPGRPPPRRAGAHRAPVDRLARDRRHRRGAAPRRRGAAPPPSPGSSARTRASARSSPRVTAASSTPPRRRRRRAARRPRGTAPPPPRLARSILAMRAGSCPRRGAITVGNAPACADTLQPHGGAPRTVPTGPRPALDPP